MILITQYLLKAYKMRILLLVLIISITTLGCKKDIDENNSKVETFEIDVNISEDCPSFIFQRKKNNLNISILLDLSSRIELLDQEMKDTAYISSLAKVFNSHVKTKKLGLLYDKMEVFFDPIPMDERINKNSELLKISYKKGTSKDVWMPRTSELYDSIPSEIYSLVKEGAKKNRYPGSDTWRFFKDHVHDYSIEKCRAQYFSHINRWISLLRQDNNEK